MSLKAAAPQNRPTWYKNIINNITIEPVIILYMFPSVLSIIATTNLNLQKACRVNLELGDEICTGLEKRDVTMFNVSDEIAVQKLVTTMNIWKTAIRSIFPGVLLAFFGSWSDRSGRRKPCMILPLIGEVVFSLGLLFCTYFYYEIKMEYTGLVEAIPSALTGSLALMLMGIYSYVCAGTTPETRTYRLGVVYICISLSVTAGFCVSGILYKTLGFYGVFTTTLVLYVLGIIYCVFGVKEHEYCGEITDGSKQKNPLKDVFSSKYFMDTYQFLAKERGDKWRLRILAIIVLGVVLSGPAIGEIQVIYLYTQYVFNWDEINFSIFYAYNMIIHMLGIMFALALFSKSLQLPDAFLGVISCTSKILGGLVYAFAPTTEIFYLGTVIEMLSGTSQIALRSITSKVVPSGELGKINSLLGLFESITLLMYGPLYNFTYKSTIDVFPATYYLVGCALILPAILIFLWLFYVEKRIAAVSYDVNR